MSDDKKKFLFNLHNFNDGAEEEEGPPPPPMFTEEELVAAREAAYKKGKDDGFQDAQQSLEKKIVTLLQSSQSTFLDLQQQEATREKRYEEEAVRLALRIFHHIYPSWLAEKGMQDVSTVIEKTLHAVSGQQTIRIEVAESIRSAIEERLQPITQQLTDISISFYGRDDLSEGDMQMKWEHGGAVRDSKKLAEQILQELEKDLPILEEPLAAPEETGQNETISTEPENE